MYVCMYYGADLTGGSIQLKTTEFFCIEKKTQQHIYWADTNNMGTSHHQACHHLTSKPRKTTIPCSQDP